MPRMKRSTRIINWIEKHCVVPEGADVGKPVRLRPFQKKWICGIYDSPTRLAIISVGRKNAKTALAAMLLLAHLCGPESRYNSQLNSAAQSRDQAALLFDLARKIVRMSPTLSQFVTIRDTAKQLLCEDLGTLYKALSAEASTAFGLSPVFVVHDELGQVRGPRSQLYEALETASGAQEAPLSIVISTQAPTDNDLLSTLIDDALAGDDPETKVFIHRADPGIDPFSMKALRQANPALGDFLNEREVVAQAERARRMPARESAYRNLVLNQRTEASDPFVSIGTWKANGAAPPDDWGGLHVYGGLDLSETNDLTSLVLTASDGERIPVRSYFWLPEEGLADRARQDRVPYDQWAAEGLLLTTPGHAVEYSFIARFLVDLFEELTIARIGFDRWNMKHLRPWLIDAGLSEELIDERFVLFGQGFQSMSPALRDLEANLLNARLCHGNHPVLNMCANNAVVKTNEAGGRKLDKKRAAGRIDGMVALAMAHGVMPMEPEQPATSPWEDPGFSMMAG